MIILYRRSFFSGKGQGPRFSLSSPSGGLEVGWPYAGSFSATVEHFKPTLRNDGISRPNRRRRLARHLFSRMKCVLRDARKRGFIEGCACHMWKHVVFRILAHLGSQRKSAEDVAHQVCSHTECMCWDDQKRRFTEGYRFYIREIAWCAECWRICRSQRKQVICVHVWHIECMSWEDHGEKIHWSRGIAMSYVKMR